MPVPTEDALLLPILRELADGETRTMRDLRERVATSLGVSPADLDVRVNDGSEPLFNNRLRWARNNLVAAGVAMSPGWGNLRITDEGRALLTEAPDPLTTKFLADRYPAFATWKSGSVDGASAVGTNWLFEKQVLYEAVNTFRERCLIDQTSLLFPRRAVWTKDNVDAIFHAMIEKPDLGGGTFFGKLRGQLADLSDDVFALTAELLAFYLLYPDDFKPNTKREQVFQPLGWANLEPADFSLLDRAFLEPIGGAGMFYVQRRDLQLGFYLSFARAAFDHKDQLTDPRQLRRLADDIAIPDLCSRALGGASARAVSGARNIVLCLLAPEYYEPIASTNHKNKIAARWSDLTGDASDLDDQLYAIRKALTPMFGEGYSYYTPEMRAQWNVTHPPRPRGRPRKNPAAETGAAAEAVRETENLAELADRINMPVETLERLETLLDDKRQVIIEGPPGAGKTYLADNFARYFAGDRGRMEMVQFHQAFGYEDFIHGIRPTTDSGTLSYRMVDGIFKQFCDRARKGDKNDRFVFVIDEINRGNVPRIFGELMFCLEYRERSVPLAGAAPGDGPFSIPPNVYVIGTMNNTDRSLAQLDYALRRRFYFFRLSPLTAGRAPVLEAWLEKQGLDSADREQALRLFIALNKRVSHELGDQFQVGHSYFMLQDLASDSWKDLVWDSAITPLLEEYLHNRRDREQLLQAWTPERLLTGNVEDASDEGAGLGS